VKARPSVVGVQRLLPFLGTVIVRLRKKCDKTGPLTMLLSICESYENRRRKYLTFGMSVYDVTLRVYRTVEPCDTLKIKNAMAVCLLRHRVHHRRLIVFETACLQ
jgi:hypothetical protein